MNFNNVYPIRLIPAEYYQAQIRNENDGKSNDINDRNKFNNRNREAYYQISILSLRPRSNSNWRKITFFERIKVTIHR